MTIDWFTFVAQILNFLVLIWLMKKFLYGPIINAMEQREAGIAARLTDATTAEESAKAREDEYRQQLDELETTRQERLKQVSREVEEWRQDHIQQAKDGVEGDRARWQQSLARDKNSLLNEIQTNVTTLAVDLSRHMMKDMADESLQGLIVKHFLKLIRSSDGETLQMELGDGQPTVIEASHELTESEKRSIREAVLGLDPSASNIEFKINPQLICGIELRSSSCKLGWNIRDSLSDLEADFLRHFDEVMSASADEKSHLLAEQLGTEPVSS